MSAAKTRPEIIALKQVIDAINGLDDDAASRVLMSAIVFCDLSLLVQRPLTPPPAS